MNCGLLSCSSTSKQAQNMSFKDLEKQIQKCENCVYRKKAGIIKKATYKEVRLNYVKKYWEMIRSQVKSRCCRIK